MKASFTLITLLPLISSAATIEQRDSKAADLPVVDTSLLHNDWFSSAAAGEKQAVTGNAMSAAASCPRGYPFICKGHCCPYNWCCKKQCCSPKANFCGADGYCYIMK